MKSIMFWLLVMSCGVVKAEIFGPLDLYDACYDYQLAESRGDFGEAEYHYNRVDASGYLVTNDICKDGRIDAIDAYLQEQRDEIRGVLAGIPFEE